MQRRPDHPIDAGYQNFDLSCGGPLGIQTMAGISTLFRITKMASAIRGYKIDAKPNITSSENVGRIHVQVFK